MESENISLEHDYLTKAVISTTYEMFCIYCDIEGLKPRPLKWFYGWKWFLKINGVDDGKMPSGILFHKYLGKVP